MPRPPVRTLALAALAAGVTLPAAASPAGAVLPGRNGVIAAVVSTERPAATHRIVVLRSDGRLIRRVACTRRCGDIWPAWSPDGRRLAFSAGFGGAPGALRIGFARADGRGRRVLPALAEGVDAVGPAWSPDGSELAFVRVGFDRSNLAVLDVASGAVRDLPIAGQEPSWAASGKIAFTAAGPEQIFSARLDGSARRRLTRAGGLSPDWSPGGGRVAFVRVRRGREEIWTVSARGRDARRVARGAMPAWSPDGRLIAFVRGGRLRTVRPDGSGVRAIPTPWLRAGERLDMPAWQPRGGSLQPVLGPGTDARSSGAVPPQP